MIHLFRQSSSEQKALENYVTLGCLKKIFYRTDYLQNQQLARLIFILNKFVDIVKNSNSRGVFESKIVIAITETNDENDVYKLDI